jgi:hypothetical protein
MLDDDDIGATLKYQQRHKFIDPLTWGSPALRRSAVRVAQTIGHPICNSLSRHRYA